MRNSDLLFTVDYAVTFGGWEELEFPNEEEYTSVYLWCNNYVYTRVSNYLIYVKIVDKNNTILFKQEIKTIKQFNQIKKRLCSKRCMEDTVVYYIDNLGNFLTNENNFLLTK